MSSTETGSAWRLERDSDDIVWLTADKPATSTNVLSSPVLRELDALLDQIASAPPRGVVVSSAKKSGFVAGADIKEFTGITSPESGYRLIHAGQQVFDRLEALPCPTVAAVHGFALGGGLELALACRYRVAVGDHSLSLGFPEVQLGIHPGFGGTVRSVRLIGVRPAMEMMLTGKPVRAQQALRLGLIDRLVPQGELRSAARQIILAPPPPHRPNLSERALSWPLVRSVVQRSLVSRVSQKVRREHYPAPYAMIDLWAHYGAHGAVAFEAEARSIAQLFTTETARNLIRVFLLQDRLKAAGGKATVPLEHVHVVGAGVMGGDIAAWSALRGFTVTLQDRELKYIEPALGRARELFEKRLPDPAKVREATARLSADVNAAGAAQADVVIEAIFESLEAKRELYATLEPRMKPGAILATNTSSIVLESLAEGLADPGRLVGLHFFNPVPQMPLVEVIHCALTDPADGPDRARRCGGPRCCRARGGDHRHRSRPPRPQSHPPARARGARQARTQERRRVLSLEGRQARQARRRLRGAPAARSDRSADSRARQRVRRMPARADRGRCRPHRCRRHFRDRLRALPRRTPRLRAGSRRCRRGRAAGGARRPLRRPIPAGFRLGAGHRRLRRAPGREVIRGS